MTARRHGSKATPQRQKGLGFHELLGCRGYLPQSEALGIRRRLDKPIGALVFEALTALKSCGDIPPQVTLRREPHVTLLPREQLRGAISRELVTYYKLGELSGKLSATADIKDKPVEATLSSVSIRHGASIQVNLQSEQLEAEQQLIADILADSGVRGSHRALGENTLHMTVGDIVKKRDRMSLTEQRHVIHEVQDTLDAALNGDPFVFTSQSVYQGSRE